MLISTDDYKGSPVLVLRKSENERYPFSFGLRKAEMLLDFLENHDGIVELLNFINDCRARSETIKKAREDHLKDKAGGF